MNSALCVCDRDGTVTVDSSCEDGMLSAVLDMDEVELYLSGKHSSPENRDQLVMPGAQQVSEEGREYYQPFVHICTRLITCVLTV